MGAMTMSRDKSTRTADRAMEVLERRSKRSGRRDLRSSMWDYDDEALGLMEIVLGENLREQLVAAREEFALLGKREMVRRAGITYPTLLDIENSHERRKVAGSEMTAITVGMLARMLSVYGLGLRLEVTTVAEMEEWLGDWDVEKWKRELEEKGGTTRLMVGDGKKVKRVRKEEMEERLTARKIEGMYDVHADIDEEGEEDGPVTPPAGADLEKLYKEAMKIEKSFSKKNRQPGMTQEEVEADERREVERKTGIRAEETPGGVNYISDNEEQFKAKR